MTKIFMVRHGQSLSNVADTFTGTINSPLSKLGLLQAELCANYLKGKHPDKLFSSDLDRAYITGTILGKIIEKPVKKIADFREINAGNWGGCKFEDIEKRFPESFEIWHNSMDDAICPGGESVKALQKRVVNALISVAKECEGKAICIFTHATPIRTVAAFALGKSIQETPWPANSSVSEFLLKNKDLTLKSYGFNNFLGDYTTFLPDNV